MAKPLVGSSSTFHQIISGNSITIMTGSTKLWASLSSLQAAPTAPKMAP